MEISFSLYHYIICSEEDGLGIYLTCYTQENIDNPILVLYNSCIDQLYDALTAIFKPNLYGYINGWSCNDCLSLQACKMMMSYHYHNTHTRL